MMWKSIPNRGLVLVVCATTWCVANTLRAQTILYVDSQAPDGGDGDRWASAFNKLQDALDQQSVDQIWVAQGTYKPTYEAVPGEPRSKTFQLLDGVAIYGGFAGVETGIDQRDVGRYLTVLSCDLAGGDGSENCYHVVTAGGVSATAKLDGFTISRGRADGAGDYGFGGGMLVKFGSPCVSNCTFKNSHAQYGGAIAIRSPDSMPTFDNCVFSENSADHGGSIYVATCLGNLDCPDEPGRPCQAPRCGQDHQCATLPNMYGDVNRDDAIGVYDVFRILEGFEGVFSLCTFQDCDIGPCQGDGAIGLFDLFAVLNAFGGIDPCCSGACCVGTSCYVLTEDACADADGDYQGPGTTCQPDPCTGRMGGPEMMGGGFPPIPPVPSSIHISLTTDQPSGPPNSLFDVEAWGTEFFGLRGYQIAVEVSGGTAGSLDLEEIVIDQQRPDFVFYGESPMNASNVPERRMMCALSSGGVSSMSSKYLSTFRFRASADASGVFTVSASSAGTSAGNASSQPMEVTIGSGAEITVSEP